MSMGFGAMKIIGSGATAAEIFTYMPEQIMIDVGVAGATTLTNQVLQEILPPEIARLIAAGVGLTLAWKLNKWYDKAWGIGVPVYPDAVDDVPEIGGGTGDAEKILSNAEAENLAFGAIKGPENADSVMLGKYEANSPTSYEKIAQEYGDQYFNLDNWDELSRVYSDEEIWKINEKFLDIQTSSGRDIYLSHNPSDYMGGESFYSKEINYLMENGYDFVQEGSVWRAVR